MIFAKFKTRTYVPDEIATQEQRGLVEARGLMVRQHASPFEATLGYERRNRYTATDEKAFPIFEIEEESGWVPRQFLGAFRPLTFVVTKPASTVVAFKIAKPFRFWYPRAEIRDGAGRPIGSVESGFPIPVRWYTVRSATGATLLRISGAFWRPWTFKVMRGDVEVGEIRKKWSGVLKEVFTDADTFGVTFPPQTDVAQKILLLAALLLIDIVHFENNAQR